MGRFEGEVAPASAGTRDIGSSPGNLLRELFDRGDQVLPGCFDALSARLGEAAGAKALFISGGASTATQFAMPDIGFMTLTEAAEHARRIVGAARVPVVGDIDAGFGQGLQIHRAIRAFEGAGIAGVQLEDQVSSPRSPGIAGREVLAPDDAVERIEVALQARSDPSFVVIARTDAETVSEQEVTDRLGLYLNAGADYVMPILVEQPVYTDPALTPVRRREILAEIIRPVRGRAVSLDPPPGLTDADLFDLGFTAVIRPGLTFLAALDAIWSALAAQFGKQPAGGEPTPVPDLGSLLQIEEWRAIADGLPRFERAPSN